MSPHSTPLPNLLGFTPNDFSSLLDDLGQPKFRSTQLVEWVFAKRVESFDQMQNLPKDLRDRLALQTGLRTMKIVRVEGSEDSTRKFLLRLHDGRFIETVLIPASIDLYGERSDRLTLCVSSQVGCAYDCKFCASGLAGFTRHLSAAEIVEQIVQIEAYCGERIDNLVFMGMGEPLANFSQLVRAIEILNADWGIGIGARRMTVSTSGLAPQIRKLADFPLQIRLAISLHGASDEVRNLIMPINRKHPLDELFDALNDWKKKHKQRLTFEFILIDQVNDSLDQARLLVKRARSVDAKVNLIPYNTVEGLDWKRPPDDVQEAFLAVLTHAGIPATLRREKGHDIAAACGQLRLKQETDLGIVASPIPAKRITIGRGDPLSGSSSSIE